MTSAFRQKYGIARDEHSFETPALSHHNPDIHPNQSYEVTIDGESVIVQGSNLTAIKAKRGYYRLLYQNKIHVLHVSEIREIDRTENDVGADSDEDTPPLSPGKHPHAAPFNQTYSVKLNNTWMKLPQSNVSPSRERPGYYNVTFQGKVFHISAVNVIPLDERQLSQQINSMYNPYQTNFSPVMRPPGQGNVARNLPGSPVMGNMPGSPGVGNVPRGPAPGNIPRSPGQPMPGQPMPPYNPYHNVGANFQPPAPPTRGVPQPPANVQPGLGARLGNPNQPMAPPMGGPGLRPGVAPGGPGVRPGVGPGSPGLRPPGMGAGIPPQNRVPQGPNPGMRGPGLAPGSPGIPPPNMRLPGLAPPGAPGAPPGAPPGAVRGPLPVSPGARGPVLPGQQQQQQQQLLRNTNIDSRSYTKLPTITSPSALPNQPTALSTTLNPPLSSLTLAAQGSPVVSSPTEVRSVTQNMANLAVDTTIRPIRRDSYTIEKAQEIDAVEKVRVYVGGSWRTINKDTLTPSKRRPGTYIFKIDGKNVRLTEQHIKELKDDDSEDKTEKPSAMYHIFINGIYDNVSSENIQDHPDKPGYKVVTYQGVQQVLHSNFIFPLLDMGAGQENIPLIPDNYRVMLTPEGIVIPKENIKPDATIPNTFMVLFNNRIYKLSAEHLNPMFDEQEEAEIVEEPAPQRARATNFSSPTLATERRKKSPVKKAEAKSAKPAESSPLRDNDVSSTRIPARPKGKFPSEEDCDDTVDETQETTVKHTAPNKSGRDVYKVKIKGSIIHLPAHKVHVADKRPGFYKVFYQDKWVYIKQKQVSEVDPNMTESTMSVKEAEESRSPFHSPVAWDKRLRNTSHRHKSAKPRWRGGGYKVQGGGYSAKSNKLIYKKMMVPSKTKGRYHIYGTPGAEYDDNTVNSNVPEIVPDNVALDNASATQTNEGRFVSNPTVADANTVVQDPDVAFTGVTSNAAYGKPALPEKRTQKTGHGTPGVPVLQDARILAGPDARANMDWVRSLRRI